MMRCGDGDARRVQRDEDLARQRGLPQLGLRSILCGTCVRRMNTALGLLSMNGCSPK